MRHSPLGDVELRHDLDARRQSRSQRRGHQAVLLEKTVNSVPDRDCIAAGLDMDVGRTALDRARYDLVDQPDDGCLIGNVPQPFDIIVAAFLTDGCKGFPDVGMRFPTGVLVKRAQRAFDLRRRDHRKINLDLKHVADRLCRFIDKGIGSRDHNTAAIKRNRQQPVGFEERQLQPIRQYRLIRHLVGADHGQPAIGRVSDAKIALRDQPQFHQDQVEPFRRRLSGPPRPDNRRGIDQVFGGEEMGKILRKPGVFGSGNFGSPRRHRMGTQQLLDFE